MTFDDLASHEIHLYRAATNLPTGMALTGSWQPDGRRVDPATVLDSTARTAFLGALTNSPARGEWTLYLADLAAGGTNLLVSWELLLTGRSIPPLTWPKPADVVYGTPLGASQLNASSSVPGSFSFNPALGAVLNAGSNQVLSVSFTPTDALSYAAFTTNVTLTVLKRALTVTALNTNKTYGAALPDLPLSYIDFVNGDTTNQLTLLPSGKTTATATSPVGIYEISAVGGVSTNYSFTFLPGTLTISKASASGALVSSANPALPGQPVSFTETVGAVAPGAGVPTGAVQFKTNGVNAGSPVPLSGSAASLSLATLRHGTHSIIAEYAGDANFYGVTNTLAAQLINTLPVAGADSLERDAAEGIKVTIASLLSNDTDADADPISFVAADATSVNGGTIATSATWLIYTPPVGSTNADSFTYTIRDGWGLAVTGSVSITIRVNLGPSPNLTLTTLENGAFAVRGDGIPGRLYRIEFSPAIPSSAWQPLGSATADVNGLFICLDPNGSTQRFYRSVFP